MDAPLTINQFFSVLAERLVVIGENVDAREAIQSLVAKSKMIPLVHDETKLMAEIDFSIYCQTSQTYYSFSERDTFSYIDLYNIINYAIKGDNGMLLALKLSI